MAKQRKLLGEILKAQQQITDDQLNEGLKLHREKGLKLGNALQELGFISGRDLVRALAVQFNMPYVELKKIKIPRPLTHDLIQNVISDMGGELDRIVVNDLQDNTFYARLHIRRDGEEIEVDARPSDAIALAVRVSCPVFVEDSVLDKVSQ